MVQLMHNLEDVGEALFWVPVGVLALAILGILLAPLAALACVLLARARGIEGSYGGEGAKNSALLLLPFVYLLTRLMFGRSPFPKSVVTTAFILIYTVWLALITIHVVGLLLPVMDILSVHHYSPVPIVVGIVMHTIVLPIIVYTLWRSIRELQRADAAHGGAARELTSNSNSAVYLEPFSSIIVWSLVTLSVVLVTGLLGFVGT